MELLYVRIMTSFDKKYFGHGHILTPLGADQYRACSVARQLVSLAARVQVVPEGGRTLLRPQCHVDLREHCGASRINVTHLKGVEGGEREREREEGEARQSVHSHKRILC